MSEDTISRQAVIEINRSYHGQMPNEVNHRIWKEINELPSAQPEKRTEERTETHACDCISRQAAIDAIESTDWYHLNKNGEMVHGVNSAEQHAWYKAEDVYKALEELPFNIQPTIEPKLIHCKDCKWWRHNLCDYMDDEFFMNGLVIARADDYCSYAERRTDEHTD